MGRAVSEIGSPFGNTIIYFAFIVPLMIVGEPAI